ncbi:MAG TPA: SpoIIE family protein phosphatase [Thermopolyspora sp.]
MNVDGRAERPILEWGFTSFPFALSIHDEELRCLAVNDRMCGMFSVSEEALRGRRMTDVLGPRFRSLERHMRQVLDSGEGEHLQIYRRVPHVTGKRAWSLYLSPLRDDDGRVRAVAIGVLDITEQVWARQRLSMLKEAGTQVGTTLDVGRTARELIDMVVPNFADFATVDLLEQVFSGEEPERGPLAGPVTLRRIAHGSVATGVPEAVVGIGESDIYSETLLATRSLAVGRALLSNRRDPGFLDWTDSDPKRAAVFLEYGIHSVMSVPIRARGVTLGVVAFARWARPEPFEQDDLLLAEELTTRAALCVDNARRYTRERVAALALQRSLLPQRLPEQVYLELASRYLPAETHFGAGGDWFDVIPISGARVALVVGDVVGHGLRASATMGRLRTAVRTLADLDLPPDELLTRLDDLVTRLSAEADDGDTGSGDIGATCLYAVYDPISRRCAAARAGHPLPAIVTPDGKADFLDLPAGPPLGLGGLPFESAEFELAEGSLLVLYTDGLIESRRHDIDVGLERLRRTLAEPAASLEVICDRLLRVLLPERPTDDIALLIARTHAFDQNHVVTWNVPPDPAMVAQARRETTARLKDWGLEEVAGITELLVSELVTNAIRYAHGPVELRLIYNRVLICEVSDSGRTVPHLRRAHTYDEGGRGLLLVAQFAERWGTRQTPTGKTIWAEQALPPHLQPPERSPGGPLSGGPPRRPDQ